MDLLLLILCESCQSTYINDHIAAPAEHLQGIGLSKVEGSQLSHRVAHVDVEGRRHEVVRHLGQVHVLRTAQDKVHNSCAPVIGGFVGGTSESGPGVSKFSKTLRFPMVSCQTDRNQLDS